MTLANMHIHQVNRRSNSIVRHKSLFRSLRCLIVLVCSVVGLGMAAAQTPAVGAKAPDFTLQTPTGASVGLAKERAKGTTVLSCSAGFLDTSAHTAQSRCMILWSTARSSRRRRRMSCSFTQARQPIWISMPRNSWRSRPIFRRTLSWSLTRTIKMTNLYGLRWDAPHETAYPSTFILNASGTILFEKISHSMAIELRRGHSHSTQGKLTQDKLSSGELCIAKKWKHSLPESGWRNCVRLT